MVGQWVALEAISCATKLDGLDMIKVGHKTATWDVHMFVSNPPCARNHVFEERLELLQKEITPRLVTRAQQLCSLETLIMTAIASECGILLHHGSL